MMINAVKFNHTPDVTVINQTQFDAHYKLYEGYVNQINKITNELNHVGEDILKESNTTNGLFRGLKRGETFAIDAILLHELYFRNIGGVATQPTAQVDKLLTRQYGSAENWANDFIACANASRGWVVLCYEQRTHMLRNCVYDLHDYGPVLFSLPLIVLDMYEHAYFYQYLTDKNAYIKAFMENIHWEIVEQRMKHWKLDALPY